MAKSLEVKSRFSFKDDFSGGFSKMMKKAEGSLSSAKTRFGRFGSFMAANEKNFKKVAKTSALIGVGILAPLALATKQAIDFESSMADVAKVANVKLGTAEFEKLGDSAKQLSIDLAISAGDAAELMAGLAQGGVAIQDLDRISQLAGRVGVAFGISAGEAGESFIKTRNALGATIDETEALMDSINLLGNTYAASAPEILKFMSAAGAGISKATNASAEGIAAIGTEFIAIGKSAEESATIMKKFTREALTNKQLKPIFDKAGGGIEGIMAIMEKGYNLTGDAQTEFFSNFGVYGLDIQAVAQNFEGLREKVDTATDAQKTLNSVNEEFENRTSTTGFKLAQNMQKLKVAAVDVGNAILPMLNDFLNSAIPLINKLSNWVTENKELVKTGAKVALVLAGISFSVSAISGVLLTLSKIIKIVQFAQIAWNIAMTANPIGLIIVGIAALIGFIALAINKFESFGSAMLIILGPIGMIINAFMILKSYWSSIVEAFKAEGILGGLKRIGIALIDMLLYPVQQLLDLISKIPGLGELAGAGRDMINNLRESIGAIDIGGELSDSPQQTESPVLSGNTSEVFLNVNNNGEKSRQDITQGKFNMDLIPATN